MYFQNTFRVKQIGILALEISYKMATYWHYKLATSNEDLSGRVLDLRSKGHTFETHDRLCYVCLSKTY